MFPYYHGILTLVPLVIESIISTFYLLLFHLMPFNLSSSYIYSPNENRKGMKIRSDDSTLIVNLALQVVVP
jgi:hypothetical protein